MRPWRTATLVASLVAAVELVLLIGAGALLVAKPLTNALQHHAEAVAFTPVKHTVAKAKAPIVHKKLVPVAKAKITRTHTGVLVLNGNGRAGAAAGAAARLHTLGYPVSATGNAKRQDYATSVVLYRKGFSAEGARLARDLGIKVTGPLDGLSLKTLHGGKLAVILGN